MTPIDGFLFTMAICGGIMAVVILSIIILSLFFLIVDSYVNGKVGAIDD